MLLPAFSPASYYVGVALADTTSNIYQRFGNWSVSQPKSDIDRFGFSLSNHTQYMASFGSASIADDIIETSNDSPGLVIHTTPVPAHLGFTASFYWRPKICNSSLGFSLFLTKTSPSDVLVKSEEDSGQFGTAALASLTSVSYNYISNEYRAYFK